MMEIKREGEERKKQTRWEIANRKVTRKGGTVEDESERRGTWMERGKKGLKESCRKKLNKGRGGQNEGDEEMDKEMHRGKFN